MGRTDFGTRMCFTASGLAGGLIGNGVSYFLLLYYSQVLGLSPSLAGLAMFIALVFDAISDPFVGRWSDGLHSKWGRRHPFLYVSCIPAALLYYALWDPPELSEFGLFLYLVVTAVALRLALTAYNVPFTALVPELTEDYDERTRLLNYQVSSSWFFGTIMAVAMYAYWLADTPAYPSGILRAEGYVEAGLFAAVIIVAAMAVSIFGTHRHIPNLKAPPKRTPGLVAMFRELRATLVDRSFLAMLVSGVFGAAGGGTSTALWAYMQPYFWEFSSEQISGILAAQLTSAVFAFLAIPMITRGQDKKRVLIALSMISILVSAGPVLLRLLGWFPENGHPLLYPIMVVMGVASVTLIVMTSVLTGSMLSDIVEAREVHTGRREEGTLFAVQSFIGKVSGGVGVWVGGLTLAIIRFPQDTQAGEVSADIITNLGWIYGPVIALFYVVAIVAVAYYQIDRETHAANLMRLREAE